MFNRRLLSLSIAMGLILGLTSLAMAGIPYDRWFRFVLPFIGKMFVLGSLVLVFAVAIKL